MTQPANPAAAQINAFLAAHPAAEMQQMCPEHTRQLSDELQELCVMATSEEPLMADKALGQQIVEWYVATSIGKVSTKAMKLVAKIMTRDEAKELLGEHPGWAIAETVCLCGNCPEWGIVNINAPSAPGLGGGMMVIEIVGIPSVSLEYLPLDLLLAVQRSRRR